MTFLTYGMMSKMVMTYALTQWSLWIKFRLSLQTNNKKMLSVSKALGETQLTGCLLRMKSSLSSTMMAVRA
jgi:hypothetical protein